MEFAAAALLGLMILSMLAVFIVSWRWTGSLRLAVIVMLLTGKLWAGILWAFGVDRPLFSVSIRNRWTGESLGFTVTATEFIFLSFFAALLSTLAWPHLKRELGV